MLIIFVTALFAVSCGGGGSSTIIPNPNPGGTTPPPADSDQDIAISGILTYTGLVQGESEISRSSSAAPIANAGVALLSDNNIISASETNDTGWFEVNAEEVSKNANLRIKVELRTTESAQNRLYAELPFELEGSGAGSMHLNLSGYDGNDDGIPDGLRLQGGFEGGNFKSGVFGENGLDMPFGESGDHFGWLDDGEGFFEGTDGFGDGWQNDMRLEGSSEPPLPDGYERPPDGDNFNNRIEVKGKVIEIDSERHSYLAEGVRMIYIFGLVFEEHGVFPVHVLDDTRYKGIDSFADIELGMKLLAAGKRLTDNVLQAQFVQRLVPPPEGSGFFALDGVIKKIELDPREIWPPFGADLLIKGVLITVTSDNEMPDFKFGEFWVSVNQETILAGIEHLGELHEGMRASLFGRLGDATTERLVAKLLIAVPSPPPPPPPPPPFGFTFHGEVVDLRPANHLVGVLGFWDDILDGPGFNDRPPYGDPEDPGDRWPMCDDGSDRGDGFFGDGDGEDYPGNDYPGDIPPDWPDDPDRPEPIFTWIKIVPVTRLGGVDSYDEIVIRDNIWSEMMISPDGTLVRDDEGNPVAAVFNVMRPIPPPPGIFGIVRNVEIFGDNPGGSQGNNGVVVIQPNSPQPGEPNDPTNPPDDAEPRPVRVVPETVLEGVASLYDIDIGAEAHAVFKVGENGNVILDDHGFPIADLLMVFVAPPPPPPPPPPASVYGQVRDVIVYEDLEQNNGIVKIEPYRYGIGGPEGGWTDPDDPNGPGNGDPSDPGMPPGVDYVTVRVDPMTGLIGIGSLMEMAVIDCLLDAEAIFRIGSDGLPLLDEDGHLIAAVMFVHQVVPPPPPDEFITVEGLVMQYVENDYILIAPQYDGGDMAGVPEYRFEITNRTQIVSESGIQPQDYVLVEGKRISGEDGTVHFVAEFILEYEMVDF